MTARAGVLVLLALALYFALTRLWPDDERRIRDTLDELAAVVSAPAGDGIALVTRAAQLGHGVKHVGNECFEFRRAELLHRLGLPVQQRIAHLEYAPDAHLTRSKLCGE